jgi:hypothetical protein
MDLAIDPVPMDRQDREKISRIGAVELPTGGDDGQAQRDDPDAI